MKKLLYIIICGILVSSCNNSKKHAEIARQQAYSDSIAEVNKQAEIDEQKRIDSLSSYALGDIKFGMSWQEILNTDLLRNQTSKLYQEQDQTYSCSIKGIGYVTFELYEGQLNSINIRSNGGELPSTIDSIYRFKRLLSQKYGEPDIVHDIPSTSDISSLPSYYSIYFWSIGEKKVHLGIGNDMSRINPFHVSCTISNDMVLLNSVDELLGNFDEIMKQKEESERKRDSALLELL